MSGDIVAVAGLTKRFAARRGMTELLRGKPVPMVHALEDFSLTIRRGETLGVVGESGCGKSTLARCLVGLHAPDAGTITWDSAALGGRPRFRAAQMVFQDPFGSLNPRLTVGSALAEVIRVHRLRPPRAVGARVAELLEQVHLHADAARRYPHEFSGGQRQRIGIARALAAEPLMLIADEPVSALDVSVQAQIVNLFLELQERLSLTLVFITHDLRLVRHLTERVAVMYLGRVVEVAPTPALFAEPRHPYTQGLLKAVPTIAQSARPVGPAIIGELPSPLAPPPGCAFHPRCPVAIARCRTERPDLLPAAADLDVPRVACHVASQQSGRAP
ncbi:MAG TPA: oligopeptide/dipeptide ABC transporter ATP-binding protein [Ktedonobacterales bacterium]|nr:oligopeptide/dipeptide ABC transporter ATP-binding protein [Ktedonobacterales bacterium]